MGSGSESESSRSLSGMYSDGVIAVTLAEDDILLVLRLSKLLLLWLSVILLLRLHRLHLLWLNRLLLLAQGTVGC
jgi:hypothetical protein